jgi:hypothetical protein
MYFLSVQNRGSWQKGKDAANTVWLGIRFKIDIAGCNCSRDNSVYSCAFIFRTKVGVHYLAILDAKVNKYLHALTLRRCLWLFTIVDLHCLLQMIDDIHNFCYYALRGMRD